MPRTFPAAFETQRLLTGGAFPRRVLEIDHGGAIGVKYYAGEVITLEIGPPQVDTEARVAAWGEQTLSAEPGKVGGYGTRQLRLADADGVLRTRFDSERPGIQGRRARVWLWFDGTTWPTDAAVEFDGAVGDECSWNAADGSWQIQLSGTERATDDLTLGTLLDRQNFPEVACVPGTEGKILPVAYGDIVRRVPAVLIDRPGFGYLAATLDIQDGGSTLTLNDTAANLGFTVGSSISLLVGTGGYCEVVTGSFALGTDTTFAITSRGCVYAEGNLSGASYNPSDYSIVRLGVIPHAELPGGAAEPSRAGYPILLQRDGVWYTFPVTSWYDTGSGKACVQLGSEWDADFGAAFKLLRWPGQIPVWAVGTPVQELAPYVYAVNHLPSAAVDRVEARADVRVAGPQGQNRSLWFRYNSSYYSVNLDNQSYNTVLDRGASDPGITTVSINNPPAYYGFADENIYVSLRGITDDGTSLGAPIVNPVRVIEHLLSDPALGHVDAARIDAAAFTAAADATTELAAFALTKERKLHDVCAELAQQCGCLYFWDQGQAVVVKLPTTEGTSVWTANQSQIARAGEGGPPALSYSALPAKGLVTELVAKWQLATHGPTVRLGRRSDEAVTELGRKSQEWDVWAYQYASSVATALEARLLWMLNRQRRLTFTAFLPAAHLRPGDVVTVQLSDGAATYFGPVLAVVTGRKDTPGDARSGQMETVEITADVQVWTGVDAYAVAAIPAGPDACLSDDPPEFSNTLLYPPGAVSDGVGLDVNFFLPPIGTEDGTPRTPVADGEEGGGGTSLRRGIVAAASGGKIDGEASGNVNIADSAWTTTGDTATATNEYKWPLLDGTRVLIGAVGGVETIVTAFKGGRWLARNSGSVWAKNSSRTVSIYTGTPGSETAPGPTISVYNKFGSLAANAWFWVDHNGDGAYVVGGEC